MMFQWMAACAMVVGFAAVSHADTQAPAAADCSQLSMEEQQFAAKLNEKNQALFCGQFTAEQRADAMKMMGMADEMGHPITADQAVEKVAQMMSPANASQTKSGCAMH